MKSDRLLKPSLIAFGIALAIYLVAYPGIEHLRVRKGPWQVTFTNDATGAPVLVINQPRLAVTNVQIVFPGETKPSDPNNAGPLLFSQPRPVPFDVPSGKCIFMDTTFLPGTIVFQLFGHEIQLIPRVLTIDGKELAWRSNERIPVAILNPATNSPARAQ